MVIKKYTKKLTVAGIIATLLAGLGLYYYTSIERGPIYDFDPARDTQPILQLFEKNWYWLVSSEDFSPTFMLKYRTPNENPRYFGKLNIKVLREKDDQFVGFTAYYMKEPTEGIFLFLAVKSELRGKGYGKMLADYAIKDLKKMGAKKIGLWTRVANIPAQKVYKRLGFEEVFSDEEGYLYMEYTF